MFARTTVARIAACGALAVTLTLAQDGVGAAAAGEVRYRTLFQDPGEVPATDLALEQHAIAYSEDVIALPIGGFYKYRRNGERHAWEAGLIHMLQQAVATDSYPTFKKYTEATNKRAPIQLRDLLDHGHLCQ